MRPALLTTFSALLPLLGFSLSLALTPAQAAQPLPARELFTPPAQQSPQLSPDGRMISFLRPWQQHLNLYIRLLDKPIPRPVLPATLPEESPATDQEEAPAATNDEASAEAPAGNGNSEQATTEPGDDINLNMAPASESGEQPRPRAGGGTEQEYARSGSAQNNLFPDTVTSLSLYELSEKERNALYVAPMRVSNQRSHSVSDYRWISNSQLVYEVANPQQQSSQLFLVTPEKRGRRPLTEDSRVRHRLLDPLFSDPEHILITSNRRDRRFDDVYRLNLETGEQQRVATNTGTIVKWLTDHEGKLRAAISQNGLQRELLYRDNEEVAFRVSHTSPWPDRVDPLRFTADNQRLYVSSNIERDTLAIQLYDPATNQLQELLYENPEADLSELVVAGVEQRVVGVAYETDKPHYHFFDDKDGELFADLFQRSGQRTLQKLSSSRDGNRVLFRILNDMEPPRFFLYQRSDDNYRELFDTPPYPLRAQMSPMRPVNFRARDGFMLHGYVTLPQGYQRGTLPFVILPHAQPYRGRFHWGFDPLVQFLASSGFGVMQVNYRGSTGYGKQYALAGRWGHGIMQQDLSDAVAYLRRQGIADRSQVAIIGERYGGYAAIAAAAFYPADYSCAAAMAAPLNPLHWLDTLPANEEVNRVVIQQQMGDPRESFAQLQADSPLSAIDQIRIPLLLAQGRLDQRARMQDLDRLATNLRTRGVTVETLIKGDEYGPFRKFDNQLEYYRHLQRFLRECFNR
ncbi:S9 family peptidase [Aestuariirhabdus litorea]|uniref:S9 family peptidase n=1 Tax=Aestuariirhabdus litorea TaxID=2528527 RepID=A0A3P3VNX4_9GAMM|nr:prolyl oligopeptidase family serine peptidase [Aestuariirhabdus litorea]RRJ83618.1 S9 family peptidase [Aestuariirhabdus litorea]RWW96839.1 S9 family peptidase [Endozoicomonadaceae bacterium GTF-13]